MIKALLVAAEAAPFVKTGDLGNVVGTLAKEVNRKSMDVRVIIPYHSQIDSDFAEKMTKVCSMTVNLGWRQQETTISELKYDDIVFYFVQNEYYFNRPEVYGYADDGERYAFFCRAVLKAIPHIGFKPDILHCHDWHTGMISVFLKAQYANDSQYQKIKTMFSVHNVLYQGVFPKNIMSDVLGLGEEYAGADGVVLDGCVNFMKSAIVYSDFVTTVSPTYAEEIKTPTLGAGLDNIFCSRENELRGIVHGIDYKVYNPSADPYLFAAYDTRALKKRQENKYKLQEYLGLPVTNKVPLVSINSANNMEVIANVTKELLALDIQLVINISRADCTEFLVQAAECYTQKLIINSFHETLQHRIYAGSDIFLIPDSQPSGNSALIAMRYGSVPVVNETGGLKDIVSAYNENTRAGNGFSFRGGNTRAMLDNLEQSIELYKNKKEWSKIVRNAMKVNYSCRQSADQYLLLYKLLAE